ncbi:MAG: DAK2 domain-containing protein [Ruminococcus sp.]
MNTNKLDGKLFVKLIQGGTENLKKNIDVVNDLNVFPIPDGDTGDNMCRTIIGGVDRAIDLDTDSIGSASRIIAEGMLLSARGNSGVILSQIFAGMAKGFDNVETADVKAISYAMSCAVDKAYGAVVEPTEGTILTVVREGYEYADSCISADSTVQSYFKSYLSGVRESLKHTPEKLEVLKSAGVVDSGGAGLVYIMEGIVNTLTTGKVEFSAESVAETTAQSVNIDFSKFNENSELEYGYCTEFLLQLQRSKCNVEEFDVNDLINWLKDIGDSIVAVVTGTVVKVHVHTMTPGKVLDYCQNFGEFLTMKIENMTLQHNEATIQNNYTFEEETGERKPYGIITVATGKGICEMFSSLGVDIILEGGQGKNPSSQDFIDAYKKVNADVIYVLPNNSNIIMAAQQAADMFEGSDIRIIKTKSIGDGYAVMSMLNLDSDDADVIEQEMNDAMEGVKTGLVTRSVRDANINNVDISADAYIGFTDKEMLVSDNDKIVTAVSLLDKLGLADCEILIAIYGSDISEEEKDTFKAKVNQKFPRVEICDLDGGQEVYDFLLIVE